MSKYSFEIVGEKEAKLFWDDSPHGSAFTHPDVLSVLSKEVDWWLARKGEKAVCLWPVCKPDGKNVGLPPLTYYVGPLWSSYIKTTQWHRWLTLTGSVYEGLIERLLSKYGKIHACLSLKQHDIRIFDWWNYHGEKEQRFSIRPRYSACITELQSKNDDDILKAFRCDRRKDVREYEKDMLQHCNISEPSEIIRLYMDTINISGGAEVSADRIDTIHRLFSLVKSGHGEILAYQNPKTKEVLCALLMLYGKGTANSVLCVVSSTFRNTGLIAWINFNSIKIARDHGMTTYDFNGANSPILGDSKHAYGAAPELFFELYLDQEAKS